MTSVTIPASVTDFGATGVSDTNASSGAFKNSNVTTVVLEEGKELDEAEIRKLITENLEPYKLPKKIEVIDEIIKTFNGEIDRKQMISKYA